jgi:hypothetical protein
MMAKEKAPEVVVTPAEKFAAFVDRLVEKQTVSRDVAELIKHAIDADKEALNQ